MTSIINALVLQFELERLCWVREPAAFAFSVRNQVSSLCGGG